MTDAQGIESAELSRLKWGIVANAGRLSSVRKPRWSHAKDATGVGSSSAHALCREIGFDPDEEVGAEVDDPRRCDVCAEEGPTLRVCDACGSVKCAPQEVREALTGLYRHCHKDGWSEFVEEKLDVIGAWLGG